MDGSDLLSYTSLLSAVSVCSEKVSAVRHPCDVGQLQRQERP